MQTTALFSVEGLGCRDATPTRGFMATHFRFCRWFLTLGPMVDTNKCKVLDRKLLDSHSSMEQARLNHPALSGEFSGHL